jgi:uncharacterized DUF497 family protein
MEFEWDPAKEASNVAKHGISFVAAARVLESVISARRARANEEAEYRKHIARRAPDPGPEEETRPDDDG